MRKIPVLERFMRLVSIEKDGCWIWTGATNNGYGVFVHERDFVVRSHVWSYEHFVGPVPEGMELAHVCTAKRKLCVNWEHVRPMGHAEHMAFDGTSIDLVTGNALKTRCPAGHLYAGGNLYITPEGYRACKICKLEKQRLRRRYGLKGAQ
jgi:HNH endonuclease